MDDQSEPKDNYKYSGLHINKDTVRFYINSIKYYTSLIEDDIKTIKNDEYLSFFIEGSNNEKFEIDEELDRLKRIQNWLENKVDDNNIKYKSIRVSIDHKLIRFLKSIGLLYIKKLNSRRDILAQKSSISKQALQIIDKKITYYKEKTEIGVFKDATPHPLLIDDISFANQKKSHSSIKNSDINNSSVRPTPKIIDSIDIFDPDLKSRCIDLYDTFQKDEQHERLDTVISEATRILEDRLRRITNAPKDCVGVNLASFAFNKDEPRIVVSNIEAEQEAAHLLFRGVFGFIRNVVHHHIIENLEPERVLQIIGLIDYLIFIMEDSTVRDTTNNKDI